MATGDIIIKKHSTTKQYFKKTDTDIFPKNLYCPKCNSKNIEITCTKYPYKNGTFMISRLALISIDDIKLAVTQRKIALVGKYKVLCKKCRAYKVFDY